MVTELSANGPAVDCAGEIQTGPLRAKRPLPRILGFLKGFLLIAPFAFLLVAFLMSLVGGALKHGGPANSQLDGDFAMFYTATQVSQAHGNPYNPPLLLRSETRLMRQQHIRMTIPPALVRVGNPQIFFWALGPITRLHYRLAGWLWFGFMALATAIGGLAAMRIAGWKLRVVPLLLFLSMPVTAIGYYVGNDISLVFMGLMLGLLAARRYPVLAGALMAVAWLMPSVTFPLVMLIVLFHVKDRRSVLAGLVLASIALAILTLVVLGSGSFVEWVGGLSRYSRDIASQLEIAPLSGLYVGRTSPAVRTILEAASIAVALSLTLWWWVRNGGNQTSFARTGWLWFAWFLATPYAHGNDVVLLTVPILVMLGRNACHIMRFPAAPAIYLLFVTDAILPVRVGPEVLLLTTVCCIIACRKWPETVNSSRVERVESAAPSLASA